MTMKNVVKAGAVGGKATQNTANKGGDTSTVAQGSLEQGEQEMRSDHPNRSDRKKSRKRQRLEDQD